MAGYDGAASAESIERGRTQRMANVGDQPKPVSLFYSYSHKDEELRRELETHLSVLRRNGLIAEWHDRKIDAGDDWKNEIDRHLTSADIVLLLVSADFIHSDYCWGEEMTKALERDGRGEAQVIPIILRRCRWQNTRLGRLQAVPKNAKPIRSWADRDEALDDVVGAIERAVEKVRRRAEEEAALKNAEQQVEVTRDTVADLEPVSEPSKRSPSTVAKKSSAPEALPDFAVFRDIHDPWCPEMVVLPAGTFMMGSLDSDKEATDDEKPRHKVTIDYRLAVGRYPVTFEEYDRYCEAMGREKPEDQDWGRGRRPVIYVSWDDARAYVEWLSQQAGQGCRLLSEAEWEYACRAGTTTRYSSGESITEKVAIYGGHVTVVGSYSPNPWGLFDMHGNVWEWVEDVWHDTYKGAPDNGGAWTKGGDQVYRVLRGGSWFSGPRSLRSADRTWDYPVIRSYDYGFRVARNL